MVTSGRGNSTISRSHQLKLPTLLKTNNTDLSPTRLPSDCAPAGARRGQWPTSDGQRGTRRSVCDIRSTVLAGNAISILEVGGICTGGKRRNISKSQCMGSEGWRLSCYRREGARWPSDARPVRPTNNEMFGELMKGSIGTSSTVYVDRASVLGHRWIRTLDRQSRHQGMRPTE